MSFMGAPAPEPHLNMDIIGVENNSNFKKVKLPHTKESKNILNFREKSRIVQCIPYSKLEHIKALYSQIKPMNGIN